MAWSLARLSTDWLVLVAASRKKLEGMASNLRKMAEAEAMQLNRAIDNLSAAAGTPAADEVRPPV